MTTGTAEPVMKVSATRTGKTTTKNTDRRGAKPRATSRLSGSVKKVRLARPAAYGAVVVADWLLIVITAFSLIPALGAFTHQQFLAAADNTTGVAAIAMWLVPFVFLSTLITVAEISLMKGMWHWAARVGTTRATDEDETAQAVSRQASVPQNKTSKKKTTKTKGRNR